MMGAAAGEGEHALYVADGGPGVDGGDELVHHGLPPAPRAIVVAAAAPPAALIKRRRRRHLQLLLHG